MQLRAALLLALVAGVSSLSAENTARAWLRQHAKGGPSGDELAELKGENPTAYALVKALLAKRSLGLLDPKHPTASFSNQPHQDVQDGPEVYQQFASPGELEAHKQEAAPKEVAVPYAEVQPAAQKDWMNWKPQKSAVDDDAMVANVLGAVAELKGKKAGGFLTQHRSVDESSLAADEASFSEPAPVVVKAPVAPKAKANGYMDFSIMGDSAPATPVADTPVAATPVVDTPVAVAWRPVVDTPVADAPVAAAPVATHHAKEENSYLKGLNLNTEAQEVQQASQGKSTEDNPLASFSWDDSKPKQPTKPAVQKVVANPKDVHLLEWLGVVQKAPEPKVQAQPAKPTNPYILDLSD